MSNFLEDHFKRFTDFAFDPSAGCVELAFWGATYTRDRTRIVPFHIPTCYSGWFDSVAHLRAYARMAQGVSAYVTINPVNPEKMAQARNKVIRISRGEGTDASSILFLKRILIDIDCERPPNMGGKCSATQGELEGCLELRNVILEKRPEIAANSIWGCSGNGGYILVDITELPNTRPNVDTVKKFLLSLAEDFGRKGRDAVHVDVAPHSPNSHIGLPGTMKCKGENTETRPHRLITVDGGF
jgi:hypothetical protein